MDNLRYKWESRFKLSDWLCDQKKKLEVKVMNSLEKQAWKERQKHPDAMPAGIADALVFGWFLCRCFSVMDKNPKRCR